MGLSVLTKYLWAPLIWAALGACSDEKADSSQSQSAVRAPASEDSDPEILGPIQDPQGPPVLNTKPVGLPDPSAPLFKLSAEPQHDAADFTFGIASLEIPSLTQVAKLTVTRGILNGAGRALSDSDRLTFTRICRDIVVSVDPSSYIPPQDLKAGSKIYLIWRSYYADHVRSLLIDLLMRGGSGIECLLTLNLDGKELHIGFDPAAPNTDLVGGTSQLQRAVNLGLMLPRRVGLKKPTETSMYVPVLDLPRIYFGIKPINPQQLLVKARAGAVTNECALSTSGGKTHVANPYAMNAIDYEVTTDLDISVVSPLSKVTGGRILPECVGLKLQGKGKSLELNVSCGQYQAIKDQGVEAACAWDLVAANNKDPENTATVPVQMTKLRYKTVDLKQVNEAIQLMPRSALNPVRSGEIKVNGFSDAQEQTIAELFDLWIAMDSEGYKRDFLGQVKTIEFSAINGCAQGAGAYAPYGGDSIYWCLSGGMSDSDVQKRHSDPQMFVYRSMLAYHETRHTKNIKHDNEDKSYEPCEGTAYSGFLAYQIVSQCDYDYCKVMRDGAIADYKLELNYDYENDTTGRKAQGLCKVWSNAMGLSGGGF